MPEPANPSRIGPPYRSAVSAPFIWPPKPLPTEADRPESSTAIVESPSQRANPPLRVPRRTRVRSAWAEIEQFWFDPIILPLDRRIEQTGWMPELIDDSCDRCGRSIGLHEGDEFGCSACRGSRPPWQRLIRLGPYTSPLSDWILDIKFQQWQSGARGLGLRLAERLVHSG